MDSDVSMTRPFFRDVRAERPVEVRGRADATRPSAAIADAEAPVGAGKDAQHLPAGIHVPVGRIVRPRVRQRRLAEEGDALPAERILEEERRSGNVERPLAAGEKTLLLEIQVVVPVRVVHQLDLDQPRMLPGVAELAALLRSVRKRTDLGFDGGGHGRKALLYRTVMTAGFPAGSSDGSSRTWMPLMTQWLPP